MALKLYNTMARKAQTFKPTQENLVRMYVCGPTVNDVPHLGHARQQITFDVLRKYLKFIGFQVKFVSNITDIEDKIINKANELGIDIKTLTEQNLKAHLEDYRQIGVEKPDVQPRATEYIAGMIDLIQRLEKKKYTYVIPDDGVYYNISKFKKYGKLSHQDVKDLLSGARIEASELKKNKEDFVLWKFSKPGEPAWDSPWGKGRPGWHIECSTMSSSLLGLPFDIHGGGQDLIFPHHEDELAQSEAGYGKKMVKYWVHNGMVTVNKTKMSKSLGNFKTIRDILANYSGEVIRMLVISAHYRKPLEFSENELENAKSAYDRLKNIASEIKDDGKINEKYLKKFRKAMDDDLNTPLALAALWELLRDQKAEGKYKTVEEIDKVFGLNLLKQVKVSIPSEIQKLADEREAARKKKDWKTSDEIRNKLKSLGWHVDDTAEGPKLKKI